MTDKRSVAARFSMPSPLDSVEPLPPQQERDK